MYLQDVGVLKDIPGYKALLKAVIKSQIQMLVRFELARENQQSAYVKTKTQISFAVTVKLISDFDFTT